MSTHPFPSLGIHSAKEDGTGCGFLIVPIKYICHFFPSGEVYQLLSLK